MHQPHQSSYSRDLSELKGVADQFKARLAGKEADALLKSFIDQLERMSPEDRAKNRGHCPDRICHLLKGLRGRISKAHAERLDYQSLYKSNENLAFDFYMMVCVAVQAGVKF
jgi:hypothetical protein